MKRVKPTRKKLRWLKSNNESEKRKETNNAGHLTTSEGQTPTLGQARQGGAEGASPSTRYQNVKNRLMECMPGNAKQKRHNLRHPRK